MASNPFEHVKDANSFHVPKVLWRNLPEDLQGAHPGQIPLPNYGNWEVWSGFNVLGLFDVPAFTIHLQLTKFMVLELVAAVMMILIFVPLARFIATGRPPRGKIWNLFEAMLLFIRDEVARPAIGKKDADRFLPYIWTVFFFILFCNLLGLIPWAGSPTGAFGCTLVLASMTFLTVIGAGMMRFGPVGFVIGQVPHMELPLVMAVLIKPMVLAIELFGMLIKHFVLSVRLLANMFAGHLVLAVILGFIAATAEQHVAIWSGVMLSSIFGALAISMLELFVAFLQAYIFAFLSALFIGMAVHQH